MDIKNISIGLTIIGSIGIVLIILMSGCVEEKPKENVSNASEKITVAVTILPQAEFVEKIGKDKVKVVVMIPPGASPHTYEPTPSQMKELSKAKMYAKVGSGVEFELGWMDKIAEINKGMLVVDCSKGIELKEMTEEEEEEHEHEEENHEHEEHKHEGGKDPHIWLSPNNAKIMVENIYGGLIKIDPENKEYYVQNKNSYIAELDNLDEEISEKMKDLKNRKILVYHPAWGYFCRDYNLTQIPIEKEGKEPSPQGVVNLVKQAKENNITIIFASPQFNTNTAEVVAKEINGKVIIIDSLAKNYTDNLHKVADVFLKGHC